MNMNRFPHTTLQQFAADLARSAGVRSDDADVFAEALVSADLGGTATHGVTRLPIYLKRIAAGVIDPVAELTADRERAAVVALDAGNGLGQVQAVRALERLEPMARECGVATATVRNSQHFGAASHYCNWAADRDMILLAMTNCEPSMSPAGGADAFFGTNPIAASFPTDRGWPIKVDLATSIVARGNIIAAAKQNKPIPQGWALDSDGNPTVDASAAMLGTVLTMAGHKGYALALMVEMFAGVLSGSAIGPNVGSMYKDLDRKQDVGHFFCLIDISAFLDLGEFKGRVGQAIDGIKGGRRAAGVDEILLPGERSHRVRLDRIENGVPVDGATLAELRTLAEAASIEFPFDESQEGRLQRAAS